jgi:hypothetical protein
MAPEAPRILVVMALRAEGGGLFSAGVEVLYTGVGKVNAAIALLRASPHVARPAPHRPSSSASARPGARALPRARWSPAAASWTGTWTWPLSALRPARRL